jgi:hypothetical protein
MDHAFRTLIEKLQLLKLFLRKRRWIVNPRHYVGNNCCSLWLGRSIVIFSMIDCNWKSQRKGGRNGRGLSLLGINDEIKFCR